MNAIFRQLFGYSPEIANGLRDSLTKKRFKMMTSQKPGRYALLRLAGTLPAIAGLLCAFSFTSRAAQMRTDNPSADRAVYLINGTEIAPERIRKIDPEQLTLEKALQGEQIPAEYRQRNAEFVFLFTAEEPLRDYTPIRIEGELHYTDGTPAKGIAVYAGAPFTQPLSREEMEQSGGRTDSEGRFSIEGPQQGILAYTDSDRMAGLHTYSSNGADPYTISIEIDAGKAEGRNSSAGTPDMVRTSLRVFITKDGKHFSTENTAPGAIVRIVGTDRETTTGDDGKASIEAPEGSVLEVSYPGYGSLSLVVSAGETERVVILYPEGTDAADGPIYSRDEYGVRQAPLYMIDGTEASGSPDAGHQRHRGDQTAQEGGGRGEVRRAREIRRRGDHDRGGERLREAGRDSVREGGRHTVSDRRAHAAVPGRRPDQIPGVDPNPAPLSRRGPQTGHPGEGRADVRRRTGRIGLGDLGAPVPAPAAHDGGAPHREVEQRTLVTRRAEGREGTPEIYPPGGLPHGRGANPALRANRRSNAPLRPSNRSLPSASKNRNNNLGKSRILLP